MSELLGINNRTSLKPPSQKSSSLKLCPTSLLGSKRSGNRLSFHGASHQGLLGLFEQSSEWCRMRPFGTFSLKRARPRGAASSPIIVSPSLPMSLRIPIVWWSRRVAMHKTCQMMPATACLAPITKLGNIALVTLWHTGRGGPKT